MEDVFKKERSFIYIYLLYGCVDATTIVSDTDLLETLKIVKFKIKKRSRKNRYRFFFFFFLSHSTILSIKSNASESQKGKFMWMTYFAPSRETFNKVFLDDVLRCSGIFGRREYVGT